MICEYHPGTSDNEKHWSDLLGLEVVEDNEWASHFPSELYLFIHSNEIFSFSFSLKTSCLRKLGGELGKLSLKTVSLTEKWCEEKIYV